MKKLIFSLLMFCALSAYAASQPVSTVFTASAKRMDPNTFLLTFHIKKNHFLYHDRIFLTQSPDSALHVGNLNFPEALTKVDKQGKTYLVYKNQLEIPVMVLSDQPGEELVQLHYQGCSDAGFCYPPQVASIKLTVATDLSLSQVLVEEINADSPQQRVEANSNSSKIIQLFASKNWFLIYLCCFGFGLLLAFTPCVLPMVPVLSGIVLGSKDALSARQSFFVSLSYVLGMALTYSLVGALVALMGSNLQIALQSPWAISAFSILFILLALSMFDLFELRMPQTWQNKLTHIMKHQASGQTAGAAVMGCLSTLILSPCVTAPLVGVLSYIAQTGAIVSGSIALFFIGLGMGTPLLLVGTSFGRWLPRTGPWMTTIKSFFGILLLGVAIYLLQRIIPANWSMLLWAALIIFSGFYLNRASTLFKQNWVRKSSAGSVLIYGLLIGVGASQGNTNPLKPLSSHHSSAFNGITLNTLSATQKALDKEQNKPVLLYFYADWCASCKVIARTTLIDPQVQYTLNQFKLFKIDLTSNSIESKQLLQYFDVVAPPTFLFFDAHDHQFDSQRLVGDISSSEFLESATKVLAIAPPAAD